MARVKARILTVGTHSSPQGDVVVTPERLRHWSDQFKKMRQDMSIPAPWNHRKEALPGNDDFLKSPMNAGYVEEFTLSKDGKSAHIVIDAPGVEFDNGKLITWTKIPETNAMVKTAVKEVSAGIAKEWKDGKNRVWNDVMTHAAVVIHPVVGGQEGFQKLSQEMGNSQWLSVDTKWYLAGEYPDDKEVPEEKKEEPKPEVRPEPEAPTGFSMETLIKDLSGEPFRLQLPPDTDEKNFAERLWIAVSALKGQHGMGNVQEQQPEQMMMSLLSKTSPAHAEMLKKVIEDRNALQLKEKTRRFTEAKKAVDMLPLPVEIRTEHFGILGQQNLSLESVSDKDLDLVEQKLSLAAAVTKIGGSVELYKRMTGAMPTANPIADKSPVVNQHVVDMVKSVGGDPTKIPGFSTNGSN